MLNHLYAHRVLWEAPKDGGSGGTSGDGADGGADSAPPEQNGDGDGQPPEDKKQTPDVDSLVQQKLNKLLPDRAKQYFRTQILGPLGFKDEKELQTALGDLKKRQDAEKTDLDRATGRLGELETAVAQRDAEIRKLRIEGQVTSLARELKFRDPQDAFLHIQSELAEAEIGEDGKVKDLDALLKKLAKSKPYLIDSGASAPPTDVRTDNKKTKEADEARLSRDFGI